MVSDPVAWVVLGIIVNETDAAIRVLFGNRKTILGYVRDAELRVCVYIVVLYGVYLVTEEQAQTIHEVHQLTEPLIDLAEENYL